MAEKVKVKLLGFSCADRKNGNTAWVVDYCLKAAEKFGRQISEVAEIESELIDLADVEIKPCLDCDEKWELAKVPPQGDYFDKVIAPKVIGADGYVFGSSVHNTTFSSKFKLLAERLYPLVGQGHFTNKPATVIATGYMARWGLESCCLDMCNCLRALEMIMCTRLTGGTLATGPSSDFVPTNADSKVAAAKSDRYGTWFAVEQSRRVAELAFKQKLLKMRFGDTYKKEFIQRYHSPYGNEPWAWSKLGKEDEDYMMSH